MSLNKFCPAKQISIKDFSFFLPQNLKEIWIETKAKRKD